MFHRSAMPIAALLALASLAAAAQSPLPPPPQIPYGLAISTESAKQAAAAAIAEAHKNRWNMAIAIVDTGGYLVYFEKMQVAFTDADSVSVSFPILLMRFFALRSHRQC